MVTNSETQGKIPTGNFRKISKPLMEKKRRARINVSLEQLKTLLENNYSQNIRKRKLEKADILELTVKYIKTLQNSLQGVPLYRSTEYQAGFRNCLNGVSQFLRTSEESSHTVHINLVRDLARALPGVSASCFSTKDSTSDASQLSPCSPTYEQALLNVGNASTFIQATKLNVDPQEAFDGQVSIDFSSKPTTNQTQIHFDQNGNMNTMQPLWRPW
ncbi:hypothetical protein FKM82_013627 [Ascaphus truei]